MKLVIVGANGPTGRLVTNMAIAEGHAVTAVTRRPDSFPLHSSRLQVARADVLNATAVDGVVAGQEAVISALGVPYTTHPVAVYSQGTHNIVHAMKNHGLRRLVCVSSLGVSPKSHQVKRASSAR
jgi:putative NADH-flavin reductase